MTCLLMYTEIASRDVGKLCCRFRSLQDVCVAGDVRDEPLINDFMKKIERFLLLDELSCIPCILVTSPHKYPFLIPTFPPRFPNKTPPISLAL